MTCLHSYSILVAKSMKPTPTLQNLYWRRSAVIFTSYLINVKATLQEGDCHGDEELVSVQTMVSSLIKDMEDIKARWALIEAGIKVVLGGGVVETPIGFWSCQLLAAYNLVQFCIFWKPHPPGGIIIGPKCLH